jgi:signal transduction histidine kinase
MDPALALDRLVDDFVNEQRAHGPPDVEWVTDLGRIPAVRGNATQLRSMLGHLTRNAYEAMPDTVGTVWVSTSTDARGWVVLELRDSGEGLDGEAMVRAVEPFFSTKHGHLGVGLSIANGIWRRHRGTLSIRSQGGEGTIVRLCVEPYQG